MMDVSMHFAQCVSFKSVEESILYTFPFREWQE